MVRRRRHAVCSVQRMIIRRIEELVAWQLATELEKRVYEITARSPAKQDVDFCRDIRRSAASAPRNISEGFGRFWPTEFAPKLRIARGYLSQEDARDMLVLAKRALGGTTRLLAYFDRIGDSWKEEFFERRRDSEAEPPQTEPPETEPPETEPPE